MANDLSNEEKEIYEEARKRVRDKRRFYQHFGAYLVVNGILVVIWALSGDYARSWSGDWTGGKWFLWPLCIWGVVIVINFLQVFVFRTSVRGEKRAVEREVEKLKRQ